MKNHQKSSKIVDFDDFWDPRRFSAGGSKNSQKTSIFDHFWVENDRKSYGAMTFEDHFTKS